MDDMTFTLIGDDGQEVECEVLFTFDSEDTGKSYLIYTDNQTDEEDNINIYASYYNPESEDQELVAIESDEEWEMIESVLDELLQEEE